MTEFALIYSTFPGEEEAFSVASALVEKRLAACANVLGGITSFYRWEGRMERAREVTLLAKTPKARLAAAMAEIGRLHPYDTPCIIALPIEAGNAAFLQWIREETA